MRTPRTIMLLAVFWTLMAPIHAGAEGDQSDPAKPGFVKRKLRSFLSDEGGNGGGGVHLGPFIPQLAILSSGAGPAPMLHFWTPNLWGTPFDVHASAAYSIYGYQYYDAQAGLVPHEGRGLPRIDRGTGALFPLSELEKTAAVKGFNLYASARYRRYPREDFYGVGPGSRRIDRTDFGLDDSAYEGIVRFRVSRLSLMGRAGLLQTAIGTGTDSAFENTEVSNTEATAPGLHQSPDFLHVSAGGWLEFRDEPSNPHSGVSLGLAFSRYDERKGTRFQWNRSIVDAREYLPLGSHRSVIALRQVASLDRPDAGSVVPFYMQSSFGGSTFLRGYGSSRFRDNKLLALAGEYRLELQPKVELALIYEAGKVFPTMRDFDLSHLRQSYGVGIRLKSPKKVHFRVDVLHSTERTRVDVKLGPSF